MVPPSRAPPTDGRSRAGPRDGSRASAGVRPIFRIRAIEVRGEGTYLRFGGEHRHPADEFVGMDPPGEGLDQVVIGSDPAAQFCAASRSSHWTQPEQPASRRRSIRDDAPDLSGLWTMTGPSARRHTIRVARFPHRVAGICDLHSGCFARWQTRPKVDRAGWYFMSTWLTSSLDLRHYAARR